MCLHCAAILRLDYLLIFCPQSRWRWGYTVLSTMLTWAVSLAHFCFSVSSRPSVEERLSHGYHTKEPERRDACLIR